MSSEQPAVGPLDGVQVLDLGHLWAAPMASMLLADQGASVVRVVRPGSDEPDQRWFSPLHRNKRIVEIDLGDSEGRAQALDLVERADVVVESFRPGVMARHGLDGATLSASRPDLVHLALPGFASVDRDRRDLPGWEGVIAAAMGLFTTGLRQGLDAPPVFHAVPIPSAFAAAHGAIAVVSALHRRATHGGGAVLEVPLAHATLAASSRAFCFAGAGVRSVATPLSAVPDGLEPLVLQTDDEDEVRADKLDRLAALAPPNYSIHHYRSADDRRLLVMPIKPEMVDRYLAVLGIESEVKAKGYVNVSPWEPVEHANLANLASSWTMSPADNLWLIERIQAVINTRSADDWIETFTEARIPCAAMRSRDEWMADQRVVDSGIIGELDGRPGATVVGRFADVDAPEAPPPRFTAPTRTSPAAVIEDWKIAAGSEGIPATSKADMLAGLRVLDLCNVVAGPNAGYVFAQLGADVIRVEPPNSFNLPMHHAWTLEVNQGKRSTVLDITVDAGRQAFDALVRSADVLIHNRLDDVAERLGLTPESLQEVNPKLVVCQISAFGGPVRNGMERQPGYDPHPNLATGLDALLGSPDQPRQLDEIVSDLMGGLSGAFAAACAVFSSPASGTASSARGSLARGTCFVQAPWMVGPAPADGWTDATGSDAVGLAATYRLYRAADGWIFVAAPRLGAERLADMVGAPTTDGIAEAIARHPVAHWARQLGGEGVAMHEVRSVDDLCVGAQDRSVPNDVADEHADGAIVVRSWPDHPSGVAVVLPEPAWVLVGPNRSFRRLAPTPVVGTHTREVLADAGLDDVEIDRLFSLGVADDHLPAIGDATQYFFEPERAEVS